MIRKGTRVVVLDHGPPPYSDSPNVTGKVLSFVHWDRTYYKVALDDGQIVTSERVRRETPYVAGRTDPHRSVPAHDAHGS